MNSQKQFRKMVNAVLDEIGPEILSHDESEFWMLQSPYEYIEYYAIENQLKNTAIALPLARGIHSGSHRKSSIMKEGISYRLPYVIHCLLVCRMLADLQISLEKEEEDIILAAALCHDMIEDVPFPDHGKELITRFHLDPRVYETVKQVSKRRDFTPEEEREFFHGIEQNKYALLVKLSDRGNNVEDLYNMSVWKVHEYVGETRNFFLPMCNYGMKHYPDVAPKIEILQDKIVGLTQVAEIMVDRYEEREQKLRKQLEELREENKKLREEFMQLWKK